MEQTGLFGGSIKLDNYVIGMTVNLQSRIKAAQNVDICASRHKGADTSVHANKRVDKDQDRKTVLSWIMSAGDEGLTLDQVCILMNRKPNELSGRFTELKVREKILRTTRRRPTRTGATAYVYVHVAL